MLKKITVLFILFSIFSSNAQKCGAGSGNLTINSNSNKSCASFLDAPNNKTYCINVKFHIVRRDNGTGNINPSKIPSIINKLNLALNPHGISLLNKGHDFINNSNLAFNTSNTNALSTTLFNTNNDPNALNYYVIMNTSSSNLGYANIGNVATIEDYVEQGISSHEVGHAFGLFHTFWYTSGFPNDPNYVEAINGSNCQIAGDFVCDTPADSNQGAINGYNPDLTNFMSYYSNLNHFTTGQGRRMRNSIDCFNSSTIQSYKCTVINGTSNICINNSSNYSFSTYFGNPNVVWSVTPNMQVVSTSSTSPNFSATIKGISNGTGIITATFPNGEVITKAVMVGVPTPTLLRVKQENCLGGSDWEVQFEAPYYNPYNIVSQQNFQYIFTLNGVQIASASSSNSFGLYESPATCIQLGVKVGNGCGYGAETIQEFCAPCQFTSKNANNQNLFKIFPNPSKDFVYVDLANQNNLPDKNALISGELFDLIGQSKIKITIRDNKAIFSVLGLNKGIYVLKIYINDKTEGYQIVVE